MQPNRKSGHIKLFSIILADFIIKFRVIMPLRQVAYSCIIFHVFREVRIMWYPPFSLPPSKDQLQGHI